MGESARGVGSTSADSVAASSVRVARLRQELVSAPLRDVGGTVRREVATFLSRSDLAPGSSVAVGCSSRGIANYAAIVGAVIKGLQERGLAPFCFPAMGSHGSATAEGQAHVLAEAGISEEAMGCEVRSSLDVEIVGSLPNGMHVAMDKHAYGADAFVVVNRVKPHTEFSYPFESGLMKMIAIGMGKEFGATLYHRYFLRDGYGETIDAIVERITATRPLLFGVGIAEDGYGDTAEIEVMPPGVLRTAEAAMLRRVQTMVPRLPFDDIDVLVIDEMGKDISGSGFDTKIVGRLSMPLLGPDPETPRIKRIVVCDLTDVSGGNADGVGIADFITDRLHRKIDRKALYVNALAGSEPEHARIPMVLDNDREAVDAAMATIGPTTPQTIRLVHIVNTKDLGTMEISEALARECDGRPDLDLDTEARPLSYDAEGRLDGLARRA